MPQHGENPLARFANAIIREDGFSFGIPRLSDDGSLVALPVLRTVPRPRSFALATEMPDGVSALDVGRIDRLRVRNESGRRIFLPPGTLFAGRGTASRGTCAGVLLEPAATREVRVRCVQATEPICEGVGLCVVPDLAPHPVAQALLSSDQGLVWETVASLAANEADSGHAGTTWGEAACGHLLLDADGVVAAEIFDDPAAWRAASRCWAPPRSSGTPLALNPTDAPRVARDFLERLPRRVQETATPEGGVDTEGSAAWTAIDGEVVHLIAFGRDLTRPEAGAISPEAAPPSPSDGWGPSLTASSADDGLEGAEVAVAEVASADTVEAYAISSTARPPRRRKVLTTGWDAATFDSLERYSHKEFRGDRSAAIRSLVRRELRRRGYMGPRPAASRPSAAPPPEEGPSPRAEVARAAAEARIRDFERIAEAVGYAGWLRKRAHLELERLAADGADEILRSAAQSALDRLPADVAPEELAAPEELETVQPPAPPPPPPADVRPLLRRAFAASAGGRYPEALTLFDEILLAEPENRTALLGRAVALRRSGKAQEALEALDLVLRTEPTNAAALLNRVRILQERGDLQGALEALDLLSSIAPNDWDVWMARGEVLARMGRGPDALHAFTEALRRNPDDPDIRNRIRALETARSAPPAALPRILLPRDLQEGQSYVVKERHPDRSLRVLRALLARAVPSLLITRESPERIRQEAGLAGARILELSHAPGEGRRDPTALVALTRTVERFVQEHHGHGVILLDGLASLALENGPREAILFVERVHEAVLQSRAIFLVSLAPGDLGDREVALLERNLRVLS